MSIPSGVPPIDPDQTTLQHIVDSQSEQTTNAKPVAWNQNWGERIVGWIKANWIELQVRFGNRSINEIVQEKFHVGGLKPEELRFFSDKNIKQLKIKDPAQAEGMKKALVQARDKSTKIALAKCLYESAGTRFDKQCLISPEERRKVAIDHVTGIQSQTISSAETIKKQFYGTKNSEVPIIKLDELVGMINFSNSNQQAAIKSLSLMEQLFLFEVTPNFSGKTAPSMEIIKEKYDESSPQEKEKFLKYLNTYATDPIVGSSYSNLVRRLEEAPDGI